MNTTFATEQQAAGFQTLATTTLPNKDRVVLQRRWIGHGAKTVWTVQVRATYGSDAPEEYLGCDYTKVSVKAATEEAGRTLYDEIVEEQRRLGRRPESKYNRRRTR